jgi:hypothetical protein
MIISSHSVLLVCCKSLLSVVVMGFGMSVKVAPVGQIVVSSPTTWAHTTWDHTVSTQIQQAQQDTDDSSWITWSQALESDYEMYDAAKKTKKKKVPVRKLSSTTISSTRSTTSPVATVSVSAPSSTSVQTVGTDAVVTQTSVSLAPTAQGRFPNAQAFINDVISRTASRSLQIWDYAGEDLDTIYSLLCADQPLCAKISFNGSLTQEEQLIYTVFFIHLVSWIDTHMDVWWRSLSTTVQQMIINKSANTVKYCSPDVRWCSSHTIVELHLSDVGSLSEGFEVMTHELGHIVDLWILRGKSSAIDPDYTEFGTARFSIDDPSIAFYRICRSSEHSRKAECDDSSFAGWYAMSNPFEDRAEVFNLYLNHREMFVAMSETNAQLKQKFRILDRLFGWQAIVEIPVWYWSASARSWDTTRL